MFQNLTIISLALTLFTMGASPVLTHHAYASDSTLSGWSEPLQVYKSPTCGCCSAWVTHLQKHQLPLAVHDTHHLKAVKQHLRIPSNMQSCHTTIGPQGMVFEGHVPARLIVEYLRNPPPYARGLAAPGMPPSSPGMDLNQPFIPFNVHLLLGDGGQRLFTRIQSADQL